MRIKSAILSISLLLLIAAGGCGKNKKPEETTATTSTESNASGATGGAGNTEPVKNAPVAESPAEAAKTPAARKHVASKPTGSEESAKPSSAAEPVVHKPVTLPEGTVLTVRLNESLSSKTSHAGDKFSATIEEPVAAGGKVAIPKGSSVTGTVTDAKARGKIKGSATLRLVLDSVTVKHTNYTIQTSAVARSMEGKGKRTAALGGGGAGAGALIGGLAGGAKGLGIGMAVGAGVGLAGGAFTGNKNIELPAETMLSFKLLKPVEIRR